MPARATVYLIEEPMAAASASACRSKNQAGNMIVDIAAATERSGALSLSGISGSAERCGWWATTI